MPETFRKSRHAWLAALLSLLGAPIGHVYCGRYRRAVLFWLAGMLIAPLVAFCWVTFRLGSIGFLTLAGLAIAFPFIQALDAGLIARNTRDLTLGRFQRWWVYIGLFFIGYASTYASAIFVKTFIAEVLMVPTRSMAPTIQPGDRIIVDKLWSHVGSLNRRDVIVYRDTQEPSSLFVKRVLAFPGERISIDGIRIVVDNKEVVVPEAHNEGTALDRSFLEKTEKVEEKLIDIDSFFVVGDNLNFSRDSRHVGAIPNRNFHGTAVNILWSQPREFPNPMDTSRFTLGSIEWTRLGRSLRTTRE